MNTPIAVLLGTTLLFGGCSSMSRMEDAEAEQHIIAAEEYERSGEFAKAAEQYQFVAEQLTDATRHAHAIQRLALLSLNPSNPARSDSAAITWFRAYLPHAPSGNERENTLLYLRLLERVSLLETEAAEKTVRLESVTQRADSLSHGLVARTKRLQQLETELKQVTTELTRLREVDVQLHRRKK